MTVRAADRQEFDAEIIAADPRSDLAVIAPESRATERDPPRLKPLAIGDAGKLRKGAFLIALGNSFNAARDGKPSASWGILSNIARKLDVGSRRDEHAAQAATSARTIPTLLQLDSKLNLGMSGGAVINLKGELVGLTTMAASPAGFDAMAGYAIPMDKLGRRAVETLKEGKEIEYGLLGIKPDDGTPIASARSAQLTGRAGRAPGQRRDHRRQRHAGLRLRFVDPGGQCLFRRRHGPTQDPPRRRDDRSHDRPGQVPVEGEIIVTNRPKPWRGLRVDYTSTVNSRTFGPDLLDSALPGVVVTEVEEGSPAAAAGIKKGQLIRKVGTTSRARATSPRRRHARGPSRSRPTWARHVNELLAMHRRSAQSRSDSRATPESSFARH